MSDLESRLSEGLAGTAEQAPGPTDLAAGARSRLRRRRRTTGAVVAAALAVAAVPVGLAVVGGPSERPDRDVTTVSEPPSGWRTETWRDLSVDVPPEWGHGSGPGWCAGGRALEDAIGVSRPGGVVPAIGCTPGTGYGAHFTAPSSGELPPGTEGAVQQYRGESYPDGAWIGYVATQQAAVWVVTDDRTAARRVLDSATPVGEVDGNGCATRLELAAYSAAEQMSVCRYDPDGWLEQSELLSADQSRRAVVALAAAPPLEGGGRPCSPNLTGGFPTVHLVGAQVFTQIVLDGPCFGIQDNPGSVSVDTPTPEVLYWALSPGWSGDLSFLSYDDPGGEDGFRLRGE